jgi:putative transposase
MSRETSHGRATVTQLCAAFDLSRQAYYMALREPTNTDTADRAGEPATQKRSRVRKARSSAAPGRPKVIETSVLLFAIREILLENPAWGVRKVWAALKRRDMHAGRKRIWAIMHANGLTLEPIATRECIGRGHVTVPDSNRRWGTDLTTAWTRLDGTVAIVPTIDFGDRFVLALTVDKCQQSPTVLRGVETALINEFGSASRVPDALELRTDHGPQYTGDDALQLCIRWKVDHTFAPVGRPTGNAVTERFIQTMKVEVIWTRDWDSAAELRAALEAWLVKYNHHRPHQALGWLTPAEKRSLNLGRPLLVAA